MSGGLLAGVRRVAVLRANHLGDLVTAMPALEALRAAYPGAELVLLGTPQHAELLAGRPGPVDRVEVVPVARGVREGDGEDAAALDRFFARMRESSVDLAVQLHGGGRWSNPFVRRLGARCTVGLRAPDAEPLDRSVPYVHFQHEVRRLLEVVALVGAEPVTTAPRLAVTEADRRAAADALPPSGRPLAVLHPGARDPRRRWPAASFAAVADALAGAGAEVVVTGSAAERPVVEEVLGRARPGAARALLRLSLPALVGVLQRAAVVVANDTGPRHLAEAVGTATVSVWWCGNLVNAGPATRARHRPHVSWRVTCPVCGAGLMADVYPGRPGLAACEHTESWVSDVPVAEVLPDALELLGQP